MSADRVDYSGDSLVIDCGGRMFTIDPSAIERIHDCEMADPVHHGDERFHILKLSDSFWLLGPLVDGALGAMDALVADNPHIPIVPGSVQRLPWRMRERGPLGLRLFPIAGLGRFPLSDLRCLAVTGDEK